MYENLIERLKVFMNKSQILNFDNRIKTYKTDMKSKHQTKRRFYTDVLLPQIRQYGKKVEIKKRDVVYDPLNNEFKLDSDIGSTLLLGINETDYDTKYKLAVEKGLRLKILKKETIYSFWIDSCIYHLRGGRCGSSETDREITNDWRRCKVKMFSEYDDFIFTMRSKGEYDKYVKEFTGSNDEFLIRFFEFLKCGDNL